MPTLSFSPRLIGLLKRLGSFYGLTLALAALSLWAFAEVADEVLERETAQLDQAIMLGLHGQAHPVLDRLALVCAGLGAPAGIVALAGLMGAYMVQKRRYLDAATLSAVVIGAAVLTYALKLAFRQPRPALFTQLVREVTYSFPSGHSLMSFALFGFLAVWLVAQSPRQPWRWAAAGALVALAALIAASRVYLGVHWPTDVVAGAIVAIFWLSLCVIGRRWLGQRMGASR